MKTSSISIVIPTYNESDSLMVLHAEITASCQAEQYNYEIIFVNDGSTDATEAVVNGIYTADREHVRVISFDKKYGRAQALRAGFRLAHGDIIVTMDAHLHDNPVEISRFVEKIDAGYDVVSGWKYLNHSSPLKKATERISSNLASLISGVELHDFDSSFKAYRQEVTRAIPLSGNLDYYIPYLAKAAGYTAIAEIRIHDRTLRSHKKSNYGQAQIFSSIIGLIQATFVAFKISRHRVGQLYTPSYTLKKILV